MSSDRLFAGPDFHSVLEHYKAKLVEAYDQLSDEEAADAQVQSNLKKQFMLDVPVLRPQGEIWAEEDIAKVDVRRLPNRMPGLGGRPIYEDVPQFTVHVPFDGDPGVFGISPSILGGSSVSGEIVGNELLLTFLMVMPGQNLQGNIDSTIRQVNSTLSHLREQMLVFDQGLTGALAQAAMLRKQRIQIRSGAVHNLRIPIRSAPIKKTVPTEPVRRQPAAKASKPAEPQTWDVFLSHASEDKPYVEELHRTLVAAGVQVWMDNAALRWGDRLRSRIDDGLKRSRFVIVVLSKAFLGLKKWTEYELDSAFALESANLQRILPLGHGITHEDLRNYSPALSQRVAFFSSKQTPTDIANELLILLGRRSERAFPIAETIPVPEPQSQAAEEIRKGETVAYAWYWTKDGKIVGLYIRKAPSNADLFTIEEPDGSIRVGPADEIAGKYIAADVRLRQTGLRRSSVMGSGDYPGFTLP
jgi:hypothetical protein